MPQVAVSNVRTKVQEKQWHCKVLQHPRAPIVPCFFRVLFERSVRIELLQNQIQRRKREHRTPSAACLKGG